MKNIGIIGLGKMGIVHASTINALNNAQVVGISESSNFIRKSAENVLNEILIFKSYTQMLDEIDLDGVVICTPVLYHAVMIEECIERGINVLVEKPLCYRLADLKIDIDYLIKNNLKIIPGYNYRYLETYQKAKQIIDNGALGDLLWAKSSIAISEKFSKSNNWFYNKEISGGGVVIGLGCHLINLLVFLFGEEDSVKSFTGNFFTKDIEDYSLALIKFKENLICSLEMSWSKYNIRLPKTSIEINGSNGRLNITRDQLTLFLNKSVNGLKAGLSVFTLADLYQGVEYFVGGTDYANLDIDFIDSLTNTEDQNWLKNYSDAVTTQRIIEKVYKENEIY